MRLNGEIVGGRLRMDREAVRQWVARQKDGPVNLVFQKERVPSRLRAVWGWAGVIAQESGNDKESVVFAACRELGWNEFRSVLGIRIETRPSLADMGGDELRSLMGQLQSYAHQWDPPLVLPTHYPELSPIQ